MKNHTKIFIYILSLIDTKPLWLDKINGSIKEYDGNRYFSII